MGGMKLLLLTAVLASAGGACRERAEAVQGESGLRTLVRQMVPSVERATGLTFKTPPVVERRSRTQVRDYVVHKLDEDLPPTELAGVQSAYRLFGLLPDTLDLRATMVDLLTEQVAGYYDPDSNALYVAADVDSQLIRTTVSHELIHALQAQYVNLDSVMQQRRQNDRRSAAQAILEGQATLAQILVMMPEQSRITLPSFWETRKVFRMQMASMREFSHAPLWLRESLIFPYLAGADFVRWYDTRHPGREPFGAAMPLSTEQILHPDRYAAGDRPIDLTFAPTPVRSVRYEDDLGEFETRLLFEQLLSDSAEAEAAALAGGWGGDRYEVIGTRPGGDGQDALVWYSVWDDGAARDRFVAGLKRAWRSKPGRASRIESLSIDGRAGARLVDAPPDWVGWRRLPSVRVARR
jgi:uncharacterized protein DUF6782